MAELTHLNEASVVHNLQTRYQSDLIYVRGPKLFPAVGVRADIGYLDLFGLVLGRSESLLSVADLHKRVYQDVQRSESGRNTTSHFRHRRPSLQKPGGGGREPKHPGDR